MSQAVTARPVLPRSFYERDTIEVARDLLGKVLVSAPAPGLVCAGRIVEVEAYVRLYQGERDRAAHADRGLTPRTRAIFGPGGHAYVYFIYGMHECLNVVTEPEGVPGCVLIRAVEPLAGIGAMKRRRPGVRRDHLLCTGPGNLTRAMGITRSHYGADLTVGNLTIREGPPAIEAPATARRVGIRHGSDWPLRFYLSENKSVSRHP
jgi:DNA-3-methyladenine glycosylase